MIVIAIYIEYLRETYSLQNTTTVILENVNLLNKSGIIPGRLLDYLFIPAHTFPLQA